MNYPNNKPMEIDITKKYFQEAYKSYSDCCFMISGHEPQMSYLEFKENPFICIPLL